jgi:hypothetical protein
MPPHCDSIDGPVVKAARRALEAGNVDLVLPYVHREGEQEIIKTFEDVLPLTKNGTAAKELAERHFFETVVRVHRAGEGAPYTGLKPAGLDVGPVIPAAERAIEGGSLAELEQLLTELVRDELRWRFERVARLKATAYESVDDAREYVEAMLGLQVWSHKLYLCARAGPHQEGHEHREY